MAKSSSVEKLVGLRRRVDVVIPVEEVNHAYDERIKKVSKSAKIDGFRPGKIPAKVIEQRFGNNVLMEVAQELMESHFMDIVKENELRIVGTPELTPKNVKRGEELQFSVEFEVYPDVTLADLSQTHIERQRVELSSEDINKMMGVVAKQQAEWVEVDRPAQNGDQVTIDFEGSINGELFENGSAKGFELELGSRQMIPGFEEGILTMKAGEVRDIECTFPASYQHETLAGQKATFKITLHKVAEPKLPEINDEFAKKIGFEEGLDELKQSIAKNMSKQIEQLMHDRVKQKVMQTLLDLNTVELPNVLIDAEIEHLQQMALQRLGDKVKSEDVKAADLFPREHFEDQARRRVTLGLLLGEVIKQNKLNVDAGKVREKIEQMAAMYHQPDQLIAWYYNNKRMLAEVESVVLEDQAVGKLLEQMLVKEVMISYEEATKQPQDLDPKKSDTE